MTDKREQFFAYDCPELGIEKAHSGVMCFHHFNYFTAATYASDIVRKELFIDVGCGSGHGTEMIGNMFKKSYGLDNDKLALTYAWKVHSRAGSTYLHVPNIPENLDRLTEKVDFMTLIEVIEHVNPADGELILKAMSKALHPKGAIYLSTPVGKTKDGHNPNNEWHKHEYQPGEIKAVVAKYFASIKMDVTSDRILIVAWDPR